MLPTLWLDPMASDCSAKYVPVDAGTYVMELLFSYCPQTMCKSCHLANQSTRRMRFIKVWDTVQTAVGSAARQGFQRVLLRFVGGNVLRNWQEFLLLYNAVTARPWPLPVSFHLAICADELSEEKQTWLLQHSSRIQITFRWNSSETAWNDYPLLRHPMVSHIVWYLTRDSLPLMSREISSLLKLGKHIHVEYTDLDSWTETEYRQFTEAITELTLAVKIRHIAEMHISNENTCICDIGRYVNLTDVDTKCYPCRYISMERMVYSVLNQAMEQVCLNPQVHCLAEAIAGIPGEKARIQTILERVSTLSEAALVKA